MNRPGITETIGALFGMAGAFLLAMPMLPGWGFGAFLVSSLVGLWNWWLGPLLLG